MKRLLRNSYCAVIPAKAGIHHKHCTTFEMDSRLRGNDKLYGFTQQRPLKKGVNLKKNGTAATANTVFCIHTTAGFIPFHLHCYSSFP